MSSELYIRSKNKEAFKVETVAMARYCITRIPDGVKGLAAQLGCSRQTVYNWLSGSMVMSAMLYSKLLDLKNTLPDSAVRKSNSRGVS